MGIDLNSARFLLAARAAGADFDRVCTVGRQWLLVSPPELERCFERFGDPLRPGEAAAMVADGSGWAEPFLRRLGARTVDALDATDYEGATVVHDLNRPVPPELEGRWSVVVDGGSLEHVFDVATALGNMMRLVAVGGHLLSMNPANNNVGHGFYQFSPELFFRALTPENGYAVERVLLAEFGRDRWYEARDPAALGRRVELCNRRDTYVYASGRRTAAVPPFTTPPQQSDYVADWEHRERTGAVGAGDRVVTALRTRVPRRLRLAGRRVVGDVVRNGWWIGTRSGSFRRVDLAAEARAAQTGPGAS